MSELGAMHNVQWPRTEAGESIRAGLLPVCGSDAPAGRWGEMWRRLSLEHSFVQAPPPLPRPQSVPLLQPVASQGATQLWWASPGSKKCVWSLRLVWVCASFALQPPANTKTTPSLFSIFSASFFLTLEPLAAPPQPLTPPWAHHTLAAATCHSSPR